MAKKNKYETLANEVVGLIGGVENVTYFTHCVTRLRFNLKDQSVVDLKKIEAIEGVVGCQWSNGQLQIIIGQAVGDAYALICEKTGLAAQEAIDENLDAPKKKFSVSAVLDAISGSLAPLIPAFIGGGFLKIIVLVGELTGLLTAGTSTHSILTFVGDAPFYFLPILVGASTAKKFNTNMALGMLMGAVFVHPSFAGLVAEGNPISIFGLPVAAGSYIYSIFPSFLTVWIMSYVQKFFAKHSPDSIRSITEPLFTILVMLPLALCVLGPIGSVVGTYLSNGIIWIYETTGFLGVAVLAALLPWMVLTGMHTAFAPYSMGIFATQGFEPILITANVVSNINQGVACAAVALKSKKENVKSLAASCAITGIVGGVTEPAMFGITLKYKTPMYGAMIGSFIGAAVAGFGKAYAYAMPGSTGIFALPCFIHTDMANLYWMIAGILVGVVVTFVATLFLYKEEA